MNPSHITAIVTGGSRGIGRAVALRLAREGYSIVAGYQHGATRAGALIHDISEAGGTALAVQGNVADEADVQRLFETAQETFGTVDIVVHCAGIMELFSIADGTLEQFNTTMEANLRGTFLMLKHAARTVRDGGRIIALSSSVIAPAFPGYGIYAASKSGVEALVRVLANELRGRNISVNAVAPGPVATELFIKDKTEEQITRLSKIPPLERLGEPDDIANVVAFLTGKDGGWINGQAIRANGGFA